MARLTLGGVRKAVKENGPGNNFENQFWSPMDNLDIGQSATLRFVPFEDPVSGAFWVIQKTLKATFTSPTNDAEQWSIRIPCLEQYVAPSEAKCPVADVVREVFKEADELIDAGNSEEGERIKKVALAHWINYSYMYQGFVVKGGNNPPNPDTLVPMRFPKSCHNKVYNSVMDDDGLADLPCGSFDLSDVQALLDGRLPDDMTEEEFMKLFLGRHFIAKKTKKDKYNNYDDSNWDMNGSAELTDGQLAYLAENGLIDLRKFLAERPTDEQYELYVELMNLSLDAALNGTEVVWDPEWEKAGIKPIKPKAEEGSTKVDAGEKGGSLKDRFKNRAGSKPAEDAAGERPSASATRSLMARRGAAAPAKEEAAPDADPEPAGEVVDATPAKEEAAAPAAATKSDRVSSLSERLRNKTAAAKAAASA